MSFQISVITATYNAAKHLPSLIKSLQDQSYKNFEWVVVDGGSTDNTVELINSIDNLNIKIISEPDFGIYDALNKGIRACTGDFYLVMGADDTLYPDGIQHYINAITSDSNVITAWVDTDQGVHKPKNKPSWLDAMANHVSSHAVGSLIKTNLHKKYGYYSRRFPIAADQLFIKKLVEGGVEISRLDTIVGKYDTSGLSGTDTLGYLSEVYRIQVETGENKYLQTAIYFLRIIKNLYKVKSN